MIIDIVLGGIFAGSVIVLWYQISLKIPQLVAIPDHVITERFHEDSAKRRLFILHLKAYYKEGRYKPLFWNFAAKLLYRVHLFLLKLDSGTVSLIKHIRAQNGSGNVSVKNADEQYWQKLQKKEEHSSPKNTRVEEVKRKE